jgi:hypothetical protein
MTLIEYPETETGSTGNESPYNGLTYDRVMKNLYHNIALVPTVTTSTFCGTEITRMSET